MASVCCFPEQAGIDMNPSKLKALQRKIQKLEAHSAVLEETNKALKARLQQSEEQRRQLAEKELDGPSNPSRRHLHEQREDAPISRVKFISDDPNPKPRKFLYRSKQRPGSIISRLSPTESRVASLVRQGCSTKEIAGRLELAATTVDMHRYNIRCKLGLGKNGMNLQAFLNSLPN